MNVKNLSNLFQYQAKLDEKIIETKGLSEENLTEKKVLALLVELAECANEWRGFKYWSNDMEPRTHSYMVLEDTREAETNPLLEEYVDCLHFILSIGNDFNIQERRPKLELDIWAYIDKSWQRFETMDISRMFTRLIQSEWQSLFMYPMLFAEFAMLGKRLGFDWPQIETAYLIKLNTNHKRQETGY